MRRITQILAGLLFTAALTACSNRLVQPTVLPTPNITILPQSSIEAPTDTLLPAPAAAPESTDTTSPTDAAASFPTALPTFTAPPSPTKAPTSAPTAAGGTNADRIAFDPGSTVGVVQGQLAAGASHAFVVSAMAGQPMSINVSSPNNGMTLSVAAPGGATLLNATAQQATWQGRLPATGDYAIDIYGGPAGGAYSLTVAIAARIQFAPGAIQAVLTGKTVTGFTAQYVVYALQGQTMTLSLTGVGSDGVLTVSGFDNGQPYLRYVTEQTSFTMQLPVTQDYMIGVMPRAGAVVPYTLTVTIK